MAKFFKLKDAEVIKTGKKAWLLQNGIAKKAKKAWLLQNGTAKLCFEEEILYPISWSLNKCYSSSENVQIISTADASVTLSFSANYGYALPASVTVSGASHTWDPSTGKLVLFHPIGDVSISMAALKLYTFSGHVEIEYGGSDETLESFFDDEYFLLPQYYSPSSFSHQSTASTYLVTITLSADRIEFNSPYLEVTGCSYRVVTRTASTLKLELSNPVDTIKIWTVAG